MGSRIAILTAGLACAASGHAPGRTEPPATPDAEPTLAPEPAWERSLAAFAYSIPDERDYLAMTFMADHDRLHLEARYNYEDLDTVSAWVGFNLSFGEEVTLDLTPMVGGITGDTDGVAPGYELTLAWERLEFYSEGEYVLDLEDSDDDYFYTWSELTVAPAEGWRLGVVAQRTRAYDTDLDVQRGLLLGYSWGPVDLTGYIFNVGWDEPTLALSVVWNF